MRLTVGEALGHSAVGRAWVSLSQYLKVKVRGKGAQITVTFVMLFFLNIPAECHRNIIQPCDETES